MTAQLQTDTILFVAIFGVIEKTIYVPGKFKQMSDPSQNFRPGKGVS
jgi:hypothetical protein